MVEKKTVDGRAFIDRLVADVRRKRTHVVVGLDPHLDHIPKSIRQALRSRYSDALRADSEAIYTFNKSIIDSIHPYAVAVKLQLAFYEQCGHLGVRAFYRTVEWAKRRQLMVIADGKRNDIGSTAQAYSNAYLGRVADIEGKLTPVYDVDCLTVNPYLGYDGIAPFVDDILKYNKGIFVLVRTSNESAAEFQDLRTDLGTLSDLVADQVGNWGKQTMGACGYSSIGAVVGATSIADAERLRIRIPHTYFLVPGYGAQGATSEDVAVCFNKDGLGAIVNASRSIIFAYDQKPWSSLYDADNFAEAARAAVSEMREQINESLLKQGKQAW